MIKMNLPYNPLILIEYELNKRKEEQYDNEIFDKIYPQGTFADEESECGIKNKCEKNW